MSGNVLARLRSLARDTAIYGISTIVGRLLTFLLVPFYTNVLPPGSYGVVATAYSYIAFFVILYGWGMESAYFKFASTGELGDESQTFGTAQTALLATSVLFSGLLLALAEPLGSVGGLGTEGATIVRYAAAILFFDTMALLPFAVLRLARRAKRFAGLRLVGIVVNVALNVVLLVVLRQGLMGIFVANIASSALVFLLLMPEWRGRFRLAIDRPVLRAMAAFALPYIPAGAASMVVQVIDRPILLALMDEATVGIYQASYRLGIFMMLVVSMFDYAWRPFFLAHADDPDAQELFARVMTWFVAAGGLVVVGVSLLVRDLAAIHLFGRRLIHPAYWGGLSIVPLVLLGYLLNGVYVNLMAGVYIRKRTGVLPWVTGAGALANVATNLALIPSMGMMGAAVATLVAYAVMAGGLFAVVRRFYPVPYEGGRLLRVTLAMGLVLGVWWAWPSPSPGLGGLALRVGLVLAYPAALVAFGVVGRGELQTLLRVVRRGGRKT